MDCPRCRQTLTNKTLRAMCRRDADVRCPSCAAALELEPDTREKLTRPFALVKWGLVALCVVVLVTWVEPQITFAWYVTLAKVTALGVAIVGFVLVASAKKGGEVRRRGDA